MKKVIKKAAILGLMALPLLLSGGQVLATDKEFNLAPSDQFSALADLSLGILVRNLITIAMVIAGLVAFGFLIYGGILWITSGGDKSKTEAARSTITAALIGLIIVFGSWAIMQIVESIFGVDILRFNLDLKTAAGGS